MPRLIEPGSTLGVGSGVTRPGRLSGASRLKPLSAGPLLPGTASAARTGLAASAAPTISRTAIERIRVVIVLGSVDAGPRPELVMPMRRPMLRSPWGDAANPCAAGARSRQHDETVIRGVETASPADR